MSGRPYNSIAGLSGSTSCMPCPDRSSTTAEGNTGSDACKCDEGTFVNSGGGSQWVCNQCATGTYSDQPHSQQCDNCPFNTYQDDIGATREQDCHNCPDNSNAAIASDSPDKCMCNMGYSGVAGQTCTVCARGKYSDSQTENNAACKPCGNGKITTNTGTTAASGCVTCEPGKYASPNQDECISCPSNTYCENGIKKQCASFRPNTLNPSTASTSNNACLCMPGTYLANNVCTACLANNFCVGNNFMTTCPVNSQSVGSSTNINACECNPGYDGENGAECNACIAGTYKIDKGNVGCQACGGGKFSGNTARSIATACQPCPLGTASDIAIAATCPACNKGKYSEALGTQSCNSCPFGKWSNALSATSADTCQWCGAGKFQRNVGAASADACLACPAGKTKIWPM